MRYISLFSGIGSAELAFSQFGWDILAMSEIAKFPNRVLAHHYPDVPNVGDMTKHDWSQYNGEVDLIIGGSPCQAFSMTGLRKGLNDSNGNLALSYVQAINSIKPRFFIWENVPGCLSDKTNAFGCMLAGLLGFSKPIQPKGNRWATAGFVMGNERSIAWRVIDTRNWLPQRRKRVFMLGFDHSNDRDTVGLPAAILFKPIGFRGHREASQTTGEGIPYISFTAQGYGQDSGLTAPTFRKCAQPAIAYRIKDQVISRKFTPEEMEILQGFPEGWTNVAGCTMTNRRQALGNAISVPVLSWLGESLNQTAL